MERIFLAATTVPTSSMPSAESRFGSLSGAVNDADRITLKTDRHSPSNSSSSSSSDELEPCKFDRYRRRTPEAMLDESLHSNTSDMKLPEADQSQNHQLTLQRFLECILISILPSYEFHSVH